MPRVTTRDGLHLFVEDLGAGKPLLLVHGFTGSSEAWGRELKDSLASRLRLLCVDLLGHGGSDKPETPGRYALDAMVEDLCDVLEARNLQRTIWLGYSMGGRIALGAAIRRPERVSALVLEAASPGLAGASERAQRVADDERLAQTLETEGIETFVKRWMDLPLFRTQRRLGPERLAEERERRVRNAPRALAACLRGLGPGVQPSLWQALPRVHVPTLLLVGEEDAKFRGIAARMAHALPRSLTRTLPQAGHATHLECPALYVEAVREFCERASDDKGETRHEDPMDLRT
jgi:2-succinyl-6-hydroxy-2,4-cyclohexadiene-1-carboxylate synthase